MNYNNETCGYSFSLPDNWHEVPNCIPATFQSDHGRIQITVAKPLPQYISPAARKNFRLMSKTSATDMLHILAWISPLPTCSTTS
jgi:hypothetical protein